MDSYYDKDDSTLVQMTLLGDKVAFQELVARYERTVQRTAYHVTGCRFSAEDAAQDAFVSAWMNLSTLRESKKFKTWVCSIAKNHARTLQAHYRSAIPNISLDGFENFDLPDTVDSDLFQYSDLHEKIDALNEKIREAVKLHYFSDLSVKEIAKQLSVSEGTVKWRLSEGRKKLREGYGVMETTYNEKESIVLRVMRQVDALKLWLIREDKSGFEAEYKAVLKLIDELPDSKEKSHALADTWMLGAWWIPGQRNDEVYAKIKKAAQDSHNEEVMQSVACYEQGKYQGEDRRSFMLDVQIPYFKENGFWTALGYTWFWLGYDYRCAGQYEKAIEAFKETLKIMPPENEYYANAKSAIYCETKVLKAMHREDLKRVDIHATGEKYRFINGKLYFWTRTGYFISDPKHVGLEETNGLDAFWNLTPFNRLMMDPEMKVGDVIFFELGTAKKTFLSDSEVCNTPAGTFENCHVFEFQGNKHGFTYCKTFICAGVGIVRQEIIRHGVRFVLELSKYHIVGGKGMIPFAPGNRWEYSSATPNPAIRYDLENFFEVTAFENNTATVSSVVYRDLLDYVDSFEGKIKEVKETYCIGLYSDGKLVDVRRPLQRAKELAETKRQKARVQVIEDVMLRILNTDPEFTPDYTEKGFWNAYIGSDISKENGKVKWSGIAGEYIEWGRADVLERRTIEKLELESIKVLYGFFSSIVDSCGFEVWSDEWVPGFTAKTQKPLKEFVVLEDDTVITPAGTFKNCRHICFDLDLTAYFGGKSDCWYAEGIGFVKFTHRIDDHTMAVWQLTEYTGVGEGYFPVADGLYRKYEPDYIGDGYRAALEYTFDSDEQDTCVFCNITGVQRRSDYEKTRSH